MSDVPQTVLLTYSYMRSKCFITVSGFLQNIDRKLGVLYNSAIDQFRSSL